MCEKLRSVEKLERAGHENAESLEYFTDPEYPEAVVGVTYSGRVVYDYAKLVVSVMRGDGSMTCDDAADYVDNNILGRLPPGDDTGPVVMWSV